MIEVFEKEDFIRQVKLVAEQQQISYLVAFDVLTNYLTDVLYEVDKNVSRRKKKVAIRIYGYFSLRIGWMIHSLREKIKVQERKQKQQEND